MASVYCPSCKAKITSGDVTCPNCGSPTSRLVTLALCLAVIVAGFVLYSVYQHSAGNNTSDLAGSKNPVASSEQP